MSSAQRLQQIEDLFHASLELAPEQRQVYLADVCGADKELLSEVNALLAAHESSNSLLHTPANDHSVQNSLASNLFLPQTISHFQLQSLLGKGGMGEVYLATDTKLGRKVALKILPAKFTSNADLVHRFEREAKSASALNHPNILTVYEIGQVNDSHYIATELIEGETLRARMKKGVLPADEAVEIAIQVAAALAAAHDAGIVHRDIKPENIMLRPDGYVKVLDFGLAKLTETVHDLHDSSTTQTGMILGTPSYMSPEQARGQRVDHRTDIWSLAVVLQEMLCGIRPFAGDTQADLMVAILEREPVELANNFPVELKQSIQKALAKDCQHRYENVRQFSQSLKRLQPQLMFASAQVHLQTSLTDKNAHIESQATQQLAPVDATVRGAVPVVTESAKPPTLRRSLQLGLAGLLLAGLIGLGSWYWLKPVSPSLTAEKITATAPVRQLTWWLLAERTDGGAPFQSKGLDWFPNGAKFRFNLTSPQSGYLYLLNEGPTENGQRSLNLLYPTPNNNGGSAQVSASQPIQTGNYLFDEHDGEEYFWIVWAANPILAIESIKARATPEIKDQNQSTAILALLNQYAGKSESKPDEAKEQITIQSNSEILVSYVKLKHRN